MELYGMISSLDEILCPDIKFGWNYMVDIKFEWNYMVNIKFGWNSMFQYQAWVDIFQL
jgi:hypothetical protein